MAKKRKIVESGSSRAVRVEELRREKEEARRAPGSTMREWWRNTYAKYWFVIIAIIIDVFGGLQIAESVGGDVGTVAALLFVAATVAVEVYLWRVLWPKEEEDE